MKTQTLTLCILTISSLLSAQEKSADQYPKKLLNWHTKNVSGKIMGTNVDKAYSELLVGKIAQKKIIVAVIDGGVDAQHEDLKSLIWINKNEIPANGIDDDNNGYIDDINGWNFLGNAKGENIEEETLEVLRLYRNLKPKYEGRSESSIAKSDLKEYELYKKVESEVTKELESANSQIKGIENLQQQTKKIWESADIIAGKKVNSLSELQAVKTSSKEEQKIINAAINLTKQGYSRKDLSDYLKHVKEQSKYNYNEDFDARATIISDDVNSLANKGYGNNDVKGPDAFHGTFCSGIIGAIQNNNTGINGISNAIEIMCLRAVPNGDEYDKDVALAIRYAVDNGAQVINMSFGKSYSPQKHFVDDAILYAESKGVLLVHAAGNDGNNLDTTGNFPTDKMNNGTISGNVLTIGASSMATKKTIPTSFSNYGKVTVDLFAPGKDMVSTVTDSKYDQGDGTSFAAPVVTGVAALVWSYYPTLTHTQLKEILMKSVTNKGKKSVVKPGTEKGKKVKFADLSVSGGIINAYAALKLAEIMTVK